MKIEQYLTAHQRMLISCRPEDSVKTAATLLTTNKIGAMPVVNGEGLLIGLLSERDLIRAYAMRDAQAMKMTVGELMTRNPVTCSAEDTMERAMNLMNRHRFRHLPIVDGDELVGIVSIRDALEVAARDKELEANVLRDLSIAARAR
jgi:CBS domain-containing protein